MKYDLAYWRQKEVEQLAWIGSCGGDLVGYIANYGDPGIPANSTGRTFFGQGGTKIFEADQAELKRIQERVREAEAREHRYKRATVR